MADAAGIIGTTARTIRRLLMSEEQKGTHRNRRDGTFDIRNISAIVRQTGRSEEHTSELQSLMRISYAVFCLKKNKKTSNTIYTFINNNTQSTTTHITLITLTHHLSTQDTTNTQHKHH